MISKDLTDCLTNLARVKTEEFEAHLGTNTASYPPPRSGHAGLLQNTVFSDFYDLSKWEIMTQGERDDAIESLFRQIFIRGKIAAEDLAEKFSDAVIVKSEIRLLNILDSQINPLGEVCRFYSPIQAFSKNQKSKIVQDLNQMFPVREWRNL